MFPILFIFSDWSILALRLVLGLILVVHGYPKMKDLKGTAAGFEEMGFRPGRLFAPIALVVELLGGVLLLAGVVVQLVAIAVAGQFLVLIGWRIFRRDSFKGAPEFELLILAAALALIGLGGGAYQLDEWLPRGF